MALDYHFSFTAPATASAGDLEAFLKDVEQFAQSLGFKTTTVLNVPFDTPERRDFARRLGGGTYVESDNLKGAALASKQDADHHNQASGSCRLVPRQGVVLVVTDPQGCEVCFGFMKYPAIIYDTNGKPIVETGTGDAWTFRNFVSSPDKRYRKIVKKVRRRRLPEARERRIQMSWTRNRLHANWPNGTNMIGMRANVFGIMTCSEGVL